MVHRAAEGAGCPPGHAPGPRAGADRRTGARATRATDRPGPRGPALLRLSPAAARPNPRHQAQECPLAPAGAALNRDELAGFDDPFGLLEHVARAVAFV